MDIKKAPGSFAALGVTLFFGDETPLAKILPAAESTARTDDFIGLG